MTTKEKLTQDLIKAQAPTKMIEWARNGFYDDYETVIPFPIQQLVADAESAGLKEIAQKARNGEYDATQEEANEWFQREGKRYI